VLGVPQFWMNKNETNTYFSLLFEHEKVLEKEVEEWVSE